MAYNQRNRLRHIEYIISVYNSVKEYDVPDSYIVGHIFPKHNIFISYRKWMSIKNMKMPRDVKKQMELWPLYK